MRGRYEPGLWEWNPGIYAPARYRKGCRYDAFVPDLITAGLPQFVIWPAWSRSGGKGRRVRLRPAAPDNSDVGLPVRVGQGRSTSFPDQARKRKDSL
jgi:hypothetical protein